MVEIKPLMFVIILQTCFFVIAQLYGMKNKYLLPILSCFFIPVLLLYLLHLYHYADENHGYIVGDWLITFRGGFVRRGLSGYSMIALSDFLKIPANFIVMFMQVILYLTYMFTLFFLINKKKIDVWFIILLLSPATLLFQIYDPSAMGRKEIILFALYGLYALCLYKKLLKSYFLISVFSIALLIATLFHELTFFYTPYFILAAYIQSSKDKEPFHLSRSLFVVLGSFFVIIPLFFYGKTINGSVICEELLARGLNPKICIGVLSVPTEYGFSYLFRRIQEEGYFECYGVALLLALIPLAFFIKHSKSKIVTLKKFFFVFLFLFLFSSPMFILAFDWGRWINIHFIMLLFTSTLLLKDKSQEWENEVIILPRLGNPQTNISKLLSSIFFLMICFSYLIFWQMKHFSSFPVFHLDRYSDFKDRIFRSIVVAEKLLTLALEKIHNL